MRKFNPEFIYWILKVAFIVFVLVVSFQWFRNRGYLLFLNQLSAEIIFTFFTTTVISWFKYLNSIAQATASANANAIRVLENRIDSALIQIADLRNMELDDSTNINLLKEDIESVRDIVSKHRHQLLQERLELTQVFYREVCDIHKYISYKHSKDRIEKILRKVESDVTQIEENKSDG